MHIEESKAYPEHHFEDKDVLKASKSTDGFTNLISSSWVQAWFEQTQCVSFFTKFHDKVMFRKKKLEYYLSISLIPIKIVHLQVKYLRPISLVSNI